ncbi:MAG: arsenic efflux protein [Bacteroidales bacterium]|nr:arsenic efflux protein [Bacteroidales bacterium]
MEFFNINWKGIVQETLMITSFVIIMMLLIEFINVLTRGRLVKKLSKNIYIQVVTGTLLGLIPGCMGSFTAVSLYTHRLLSFGALVATMIATSGDEAYFMLAWIPKQALLIFAIVSALALVVGFITDKIFKNKNFAEKHEFSFDIHEKNCNDKGECLFALKNINVLPARLILVAIIGFVLTLTLTGWIGHSHSDKLMFSLPQKGSGEMVQISDIHDSGVEQTEHIHSEDCEHSENHDHTGHAHNHEHPIDWIKLTIIISSILALIIILFSSNHFVKKHLIDHVIKKHLLKIFLWIAGTLILINLLLHNFDVGSWIYSNMFFILIIALLLGIIPQSGPHLVFVVMFIQGLIPFSILLASSIVQDGHGSLPLLAESKKSFVIMKIINILVGLLVGSIGLLFNF